MLGAREVQPLVHVPFQFVNSHDRDPDQIMIDHSIQIISRQDRPYRNRIIALRWLSNTRVVLRLHLRAASEMKCEDNFYSELECIILINIYVLSTLVGHGRKRKLPLEKVVSRGLGILERTTQNSRTTVSPSTVPRRRQPPRNLGMHRIVGSIELHCQRRDAGAPDLRASEQDTMRASLGAARASTYPANDWYTRLLTAVVKGAVVNGISAINENGAAAIEYP